MRDSSRSFDCASRVTSRFAQDNVQLRWCWLGVHLVVDGDELPAPLGGEIFELGILDADEVELLFAAPAFELFFAGDGLIDAFVRLVIEEAGAAIAFGEALEGAVLVLAYAGVHVAGDADVECAGGASHDVGVAGFHLG